LAAASSNEFAYSSPHGDNNHSRKVINMKSEQVYSSYRRLLVHGKGSIPCKNYFIFLFVNCCIDWSYGPRKPTPCLNYYFLFFLFIRRLLKQRYKHLSKQRFDIWNPTVHSPDTQHLCFRRMSSFRHSSPLWLVCLCKNNKSKHLQEALLWWLLG